MEVLFLGTSAGCPSATRNVQACAVRLESGDYVIVDGGEGTQQQLLKGSQNVWPNGVALKGARKR
jgi:ribonuclease BN (tRNA processing enzyme)